MKKKSYPFRHSYKCFTLAHWGRTVGRGLDLSFHKQSKIKIFFSSAHDNDVKEANKQKGQHGSQATQHSLFQATQPPQQAHLQQHIPHYVQAHQTPLQYPQTTPQQNCQRIVSSSHTSSYPLQTCPAGLQGGVQAQGPMQPAGVSLAVPIEVKPCLSVSYNRSYQLAGRYPCITPCFER